MDELLILQSYYEIPTIRDVRYIYSTSSKYFPWNEMRDEKEMPGKPDFRSSMEALPGS